MSVKTIKLADGRRVAFEVQDGGGKTDSFFILGVRKCGSSIMNSIVESLATINGYKFVDVAGKFFAANVIEHDWRNDPAILSMIQPGNVYGGFRAMPFIFRESPRYREAKKIVLIRDPRDALISEYFSTSFSHSLPKDEEEVATGAREEFLLLRERAKSAQIAEYVKTRSIPLNRTLLWYTEEVSDPLTKIFKYEDVILNKRQWVADIAKHFGWDGGSPEFLDGMMSWADVVPSEERATEFIRKVTPGDHKDKLSREVIAELEADLAPCMRLFGYK